MTNEGWRKSTRSGTQGDNCVEVRLSEGGFQVRDSKLGDASPIFDVKPEEFFNLLSVTRES